jgi:release factor glutamine methyltransferase
VNLAISPGVTVKDLQEQLFPIFREVDAVSAHQHIRWLLERLLDCSYSQILSRFDYSLTTKQYKTVIKWVESYTNQIPLPYILGTTDFMGLEFIVNDKVLIPRSDTETMVTKAIELVSQKIQDSKSYYQKNPYRILDLGTGSGVIAVSLGKLVPFTQITATDKSFDAIAIAKKNAAKHQVSILFKEGDWFSAIETGNCFDLIISNPPYIKKDEILDKSLNSEPKMALYADNKGLSDIQKIADEYVNYLSPDGLLMLEHGYEQGQQVRNIFDDKNADAIETHQDLAGRERFTIVQNIKRPFAQKI